MSVRILLLGFALLSSVVAQAQVAPAQKDCDLSAPQICALHVLQDEARIVTSPLRIRGADWLWVVPFAAGTGYTLTQDAGIMQDLGHDPGREKDFNTVSNVLGIYAPVGYSVVGYIAGSVRHDDHLRETSVLAAEAEVDALILNTGLQYATNRQDPKQGSQTGKFWPHGPSGWPNGTSMPSEHAINVWSFAHVVAGEYPGWRTKLIVYSMATTVSFSRVLARQHFPSDVIVGSTFGYLIEGLVFHQRLPEWTGFRFSSIQTPNGKGFQISYDFNRHRGE
jgi:PAP2 superfamily